MLSFQPFPIENWVDIERTEDNIFDTLEFLYDHISKPGEWTQMTSDSGYNYYGYDGYDEETGKSEFREHANLFLTNYKTGFQLSDDGKILAMGEHGLQHILDADIPAYDESNVDSKVRRAISKWRNRQLSMTERKEAIRELVDVFEWLKKTKRLERVLDSKDESALFDIANNFGIRHHNPKQKQNYDSTIWYPWMFHFYLATYHAVIRLLLRAKKKTVQQKASSSS